ncbi:MAG: hypothetical protein DRQ88_12820 [Epsilonproteobacteria bacterium]|nr:MAG: hypothetical protein DRQ89_12725 [Campylobacterota bacterium]RLA63097.1 MAG: hypothetical protein DRQ88_12820 [Campylobacterota bacterium]
MGKIDLIKLKRTPLFRKIAMGSWKNAKDPSVYGIAEIDMLPAMEALEKYQEKHLVKITPTHLVGRAITYCLQKRPEINGLIRGSRIYLRKEVDLFFQVSIPGKGHDKSKNANLAGTVVRKSEEKNLGAIAKELTDSAGRMKKGNYGELKSSMRVFKYLPWWMVGIGLNISSWLIYGLNINLSFLGLPRDPFGSIMITNIGGLGVEVGLVPLVPYSRVPILISVGRMTKKPWVIDDKVVVRPIMSIGVTFDHRFIDGIHVAQMAEDFKYCFANPEKILFNDDFDMKSARTDYSQLP